MKMKMFERELPDLSAVEASASEAMISSLAVT